eukprot:8085819-Lingulodinium_polyedra.AAC.1
MSSVGWPAFFERANRCALSGSGAAAILASGSQTRRRVVVGGRARRPTPTMDDSSPEIFPSEAGGARFCP